MILNEKNHEDNFKFHNILSTKINGRSQSNPLHKAETRNKKGIKIVILKVFLDSTMLLH